MNSISKRIFVVEDEALVVMELEHRLASLGYAVCGAAKRGEGLTPVVLDAGPDLILMDISLAGEIDGIEAARAILDVRDIPVVFLTAYSDDAVLKRAMDVVPYGFLVKPFDERELHSTIQAALQRHAEDMAVRQERAQLWERSVTPMVRTGVDGRVISVNPAAVRFHGYDSEAECLAALSGGAWQIYVDPNDRERMLQTVRETGAATGFECEMLRHRSRERRWVSQNIWTIRDRDGEIKALEGQFEDITERKAAEEALKDANRTLEIRVAERTEDLATSEERLRQAVEMAQLGHYIWDVVEDRCLFCSEEHARIRKMSVDEYQPQASVAHGLTHPEDLDFVRAGFEDLRRGHDRDCEFRIITPDGAIRYVREIGRPIFDETGKVVREIGTCQDITQQKHLEAALREAHDILSTGIDALPVGFAAYDDERRLQVCNRQYRAMFPKTAPLIEPGVTYDTLVLDSAEAVSAATGYDDPDHYVQDRLGSIGEDGKKWTYRQSAGRWITVTDHASGNGGFISIVQDITDDRRQQEQLLQAQKMEALGKLTGGVAHDFNNLLTVIQGNLELLELEGLTGEGEECRSDALAATKRGATLTQQLLAFGRRAHLQPTAADLNAEISGMHRMLRQALPGFVEFAMRLDPGLHRTRVDTGQLKNAILNLVLNARDAMPEGGKLTLETRNVTRDSEAAAGFPDDLAPGTYVTITITDTGQGMSREMREAAFEPFFTTKPVGQGSGMGLPMVHGFVEQSGGVLDLQSDVGIGTQFRIYLPSETGQEVAEARAEIRPRSEASKHILLVEDDPKVRRTVLRQLTHLGYAVTESGDAATALEVLKEGGDIDLVLTDIEMGGDLDGVELAEIIGETSPDLPVILMSGYSRELADRQPTDRTTTHLIKPVRLDDLADALTATLDRSG